MRSLNWQNAENALNSRVLRKFARKTKTIVKQMSNKCQTADKDKEKDKDKDKDGDGDKDKEKVCDLVATAFNTSTTAFGKIKILSDKQKDAVYNAYKRFGTERLEELFKTAELSRFLKGENKQGWVANFDWLIDINNIPKVLNGNYNELFDISGGIGPPDSDKALSGTIRRGFGDIDGEKRVNSSFNLDEFVEAALKRGFDD